MNGAHDMGGAHGFGPVEPEFDEPPFHAEWEKRVLALTLASAAHGRWNLDESRFTRENVSPSHYLSRSYYEMWLDGIETLLVDTGLVRAEEITAAADGAHFERVAEPPLTADRVASVLAEGHSARVDADVAPLFAVGDRAQVKNANPRGHTRAPRYARGRTGVIERDHGVFVFADTHAGTGDPKPQHVYSVCFDATELWGADAQDGSVNVDLWDDHLERVP